MPNLGDLTPELDAAAAELEEDYDSFSFYGKDFRLAKSIPALAAMRFARVAERGESAESMRGMAAIYDICQACIIPEDWSAFEDVVDAERLDTEKLMPVVQTLMEWITGRPTRQQSGSSPGLPPATASSRDDSPSQESTVTSLRPDLDVPMVSVDQLIEEQARRASSG